jgi:hypothetical protein
MRGAFWPFLGFVWLYIIFTLRNANTVSDDPRQRITTATAYVSLKHLRVFLCKFDTAILAASCNTATTINN